MCNTTPVSQSARTHRLGWRKAHASSIDEKVLYISLRQLPPRLVRVLLVYIHCTQHGITVTWEWAETCDAWRLPMVQNVFAKYQPWMCVVKGCRVQSKEHGTWRVVRKGLEVGHNSCRGGKKAMNLPCKCTQKHVPCLTRQSAYYTEDFARRVTRALLHQFDVRSLFHEVRGEQAAPKFLVGCSGGVQL